MDRTEFERRLKSDGYSQIETKITRSIGQTSRMGMTSQYAGWCWRARSWSFKAISP